MLTCEYLSSQTIHVDGSLIETFNEWGTVLTVFIRWEVRDNVPENIQMPHRGNYLKTPSPPPGFGLSCCGIRLPSSLPCTSG